MILHLPCGSLNYKRNCHLFGNRCEGFKKSSKLEKLSKFDDMKAQCLFHQMLYMKDSIPSVYELQISKGNRRWDHIGRWNDSFN